MIKIYNSGDDLMSDILIDAVRFLNDKTNDIDHNLSVSKILYNMKCDDNDAVVSGILHNILDFGVSIQNVENNFGMVVAAIVEQISEDKNLTWSERKHDFFIMAENAPSFIKSIVLADCYDHVKRIVFDNSINNNTEDLIWYYDNMLSSLKPKSNYKVGYKIYYQKFKDIVQFFK